MIIKWTKKSSGATYDITKAVGTITWNGSTTQAARQASITVLNAPSDPNIKKLKLNLAVGDVIALYEDGKNIFYGEIQTSEKRGEIGTSVDESGAYDTIMAAYTKAAKSTGKKYMCYMQGKKFCTKVKGTVVSGYSLDERRNIVSSSYEETIENMVDQVRIYNDKGKQIGVVKNAGHLKRYGLYQEIYTKEKGVNAKKAARHMLVGVEKRVNAEVIDGNIKCTAGSGIKVHDKATGLDGLFWIDSDTHTWEGGRHTMSLELNFKNVMDKKTT